MNICSISNCSRVVVARGWCNVHYRRWQRHKDPLKTVISTDGTGCLDHGYIRIYVNGRKTYEHRHKIEQSLGRRLKPTEVVHHKDGNKTNNSIENLELLDSQSLHAKRHKTYFSNGTHKECSKCRTIFPRTLFGKQKQKTSFDDPHRSMCKSCNTIFTREAKRIYYMKNKDFLREKNRQWRIKMLHLKRLLEQN